MQVGCLVFGSPPYPCATTPRDSREGLLDRGSWVVLVKAGTPLLLGDVRGIWRG